MFSFGQFVWLLVNFMLTTNHFIKGDYLETCVYFILRMKTCCITANGYMAYQVMSNTSSSLLSHQGQQGAPELTEISLTEWGTTNSKHCEGAWRESITLIKPNRGSIKLIIGERQCGVTEQSRPQQVHLEPVLRQFFWLTAFDSTEFLSRESHCWTDAFLIGKNVCSPTSWDEWNKRDEHSWENTQLCRSGI